MTSSRIDGRPNSVRIEKTSCSKIFWIYLMIEEQLLELSKLIKRISPKLQQWKKKISRDNLIVSSWSKVDVLGSKQIKTSTEAKTTEKNENRKENSKKTSTTTALVNVDAGLVVLKWILSTH
jgi:hypothetical protein